MYTSPPKPVYKKEAVCRHSNVYARYIMRGLYKAGFKLYRTMPDIDEEYLGAKHYVVTFEKTGRLNLIERNTKMVTRVKFKISVSRLPWDKTPKVRILEQKTKSFIKYTDKRA